jgi:hypothetical protein
LPDYYSDFLKPTSNAVSNSRSSISAPDNQLAFHSEIASVVFGGPSRFEREARETRAMQMFFQWIKGPIRADIAALKQGLIKVDGWLFPRISGAKRLEIIRSVEEIDPALLDVMPNSIAMRNHLVVAREQAISFNPIGLQNLAAALKKERFPS